MTHFFFCKPPFHIQTMDIIIVLVLVVLHVGCKTFLQCVVSTFRNEKECGPTIWIQIGMCFVLPLVSFCTVEGGHSSLRCTAAFVICINYSLFLAFFQNTFFVYAFPRSLFRQSFHISCGLTRFRQRMTG